MSETPRLSRRELRELGKLQARPADAESLTETTEVHLRRPSRKEMREARKAESGIIQKIDDETIAQFEAEKARAQAPAEEQVVPEDPALTDGAEEQSTPARTSVFDRFNDDADAADADVAEGADGSAASEAADVAEVPEPEAVPLHERLRAMTRRDRGAHKSDDVVESTDTVESPDTVEPTGDVEEPASETGEPAGETHEKSTVTRTSVIDASDVEDYELESDVAEPAADETQVVAPTAATAVGVDEYYAEEEEEVTPRRTVLNYILLILIAVLVGLLVGMWINNAFLSAAPLASDVAGATEALLL